VFVILPKLDKISCIVGRLNNWDGFLCECFV